MRLPLLMPRGIVRTGLVAWYDFLQGADAQVLYDKWVNGYNGQLGSTSGVDANDPTWVAQGLSFVTNDYVQVTRPPALTAPSELTVTVVSLSNAVVNRAPYATCFISGYKGWRFTQAAVPSNSMALGIARDSNGQYSEVASSANALQVAAWQCLTVRKSAAAVDFFVNLTAAGSGTLAEAAIKAATNPLRIGYEETNVAYLSAMIAYELLYSRALTDAEVARNYAYLRSALAPRGVTLP